MSKSAKNGSYYLKGFLILLVLMVLGAWYGYEKLPRFSSVPEAPVVGVPAGALDHKPIPAYSGPHPRLLKRPQETFPFPIKIGESGPVDPLFAGPNSYPFYCGNNSITGEQPLVDNQRREGVPVFALDKDGNKTGEIIGYSRDCSHTTDVGYYYQSTRDGKFHPLSEAAGDIAQITVRQHKVDFVVRLETGTINRFFYAIAALRGEGGSAARPSGKNWNQRLIYQLRGGVGIGRRQGNIGTSDILERRADQIARGYAVIYSTANRTSNHYDIWLSEDTARRLKKQFAALYGKPRYTVGLGGSGGAIQQYLFAQNAPGLIDAAIPLYSFPDMVTQTIYVFDCEPLEYFFDVLDSDNPRWRNAAERSLVEGLSASNTVEGRFSSMKTAAALFDNRYRNKVKGTTECAQSWRGLVPRVNNPNFVDFSKNYSEDVASRTHWSHWEDLRRFYGAGSSGYANSTWDNVGVQYGLRALTNGNISVNTFLKLNATIGGWKSPQKQVDEKFWFLNGGVLPLEFSIWSDQNMNLGSLDSPAKRSKGNIEAIEGIFRSGHVFLGDAEIPIIDLRHYLDDDLNMHHSSASFSARERIRRSRGHADNQLIWVSDKRYSPINEALTTVDHWMQNIIEHPDAGVVANRPAEAVDKCFDQLGGVIASGGHVWDGSWNGQPNGACMKEYPIHSTSRQVAGAPITGDVYKCALQPVQAAIEHGLYAPYTEEIVSHIADLKRIFPAGVCDYSKPGIGQPQGRLALDDKPIKIAGQRVAPDYPRVKRSAM
ncbi:DUF6351 family protein [Microbulbifer sp. SAOS-129_SWC]|uniref:DUF6351 family protein n=1 Tax=Microbulbifer sp. SAOS-129_SWC TaxID=3145235 RepID=UPI003216926E